MRPGPRTVRLDERTAEKLKQFLRRYRSDVRQLDRMVADGAGELGAFVDGMTNGDLDDAEQLLSDIEQALERRPHV